MGNKIKPQDVVRHMMSGNLFYVVNCCDEYVHCKNKDIVDMVGWGEAEMITLFRDNVKKVE